MLQTSTTGAYNPYALIPSSDAGIVLIVIAVIVSMRLYRGMSGTRFSKINLYRLPALYLLILIISLASLQPGLTEIAVTIAAIVIGFLVGRHLAGGVQFFEKDGRTYYRRSPFIMIIWLISFILRFGVDFLLPTNYIAAILVDILLAGTTGLIMGEAYHTSRMYKKYASGSAKKSGRA